MARIGRREVGGARRLREESFEIHCRAGQWIRDGAEVCDRPVRAAGTRDQELQPALLEGGAEFADKCLPIFGRGPVTGLAYV